MALEADGFEVIERYDLVQVSGEDDLAKALHGAWAVVAGSERYTARVMEHALGLRAIARCGIGFDAIDIVAATGHRIAVLTTPAANTEAVADFTLALLLACARRLIELDGLVREGKWRPNWIGRDLAGATVGLIGLGAVGKAVAQRLSGFGGRIIAVEPAPDVAVCQRLNIQVMSLSEMLPLADFVSVHAPLTKSTHHLLGAPELALLRRGAIVVNTSRGSLIDQAALVAVLKTGHVAFAGLDVFESEPLLPNDPIAQLPNVVLTSHMAAFTQHAVARMTEQVACGLVDLASGRVPDGCVNAEIFTNSRTRTDRPRTRT